MKVVITGSFDPITKGHIYLLKETLKLFDEVYLAMLINPEKKYMFAECERIKMMNEAIKGIDNAHVASYNGYAVDFCKSVGACLMVRGIRNATDLIYEVDLRQQNLDFGAIDTIFILANDENKSVSSTSIRKNLKI
ncbi:MAG: pantetheine-phosphate adenylyltransferase [Clostridia bacterium]